VPGDPTLVVPTADDLPIIEAYLRAELVYFRAATKTPMDLDDPGWKEAYADGGAAYRTVLEPRRQAGQHVELDLGVVLRPHVLDGGTNSAAVVFDCVLDGSFFESPDGSLPNGSTRGIVPEGRSSVINSAPAGLRVTRDGQQNEACG
jgi:hypothetical protein